MSINMVQNPIHSFQIFTQAFLSMFYLHNITLGTQVFQNNIVCPLSFQQHPPFSILISHSLHQPYIKSKLT